MKKFFQIILVVPPSEFRLGFFKRIQLFLPKPGSFGEQGRSGLITDGFYGIISARGMSWYPEINPRKMILHL